MTFVKLLIQLHAPVLFLRIRVLFFKLLLLSLAKAKRMIH